MTSRRLVADAGGTNVRFAIAGADGALDEVRRYRVADFPTFADALLAYRRDAPGSSRIGEAAIAAAGPVDGGCVKITNNPWTIDRAEVAQLLGGAATVLMNDLEAVAASLPFLNPDDLRRVGGPAPAVSETRTMLAVNVGTGFGAASIIRRDGRWWTCPSEAGHMSFGGMSRDEISWLPEHATVESVLSGRGLVRLHARLAGIAEPASDDDVRAVLAKSSADPAAAQAVRVFTTALGRIAGDLALATCAWGGVYLFGSVALGWSTIANAQQFRHEFERKGPMSPRMVAIPSAAICRENAALFGLAKLVIPR